MTKLFISHSPEDSKFSDWLKVELEKLQYEITSHSKDGGGGKRRIEITQDALDRAEMMILIITPQALSSAQVNSQWSYYAEREKKVIPLRLKPVESLNYFLAALQSIDFYGENHDTALSRLHNTLTTAPPDATVQLPDYPPDRETPSLKSGWTQADEYTAWEAGIEHVYKDFPVNQHLQWLQNAHQRVRVLNTWTRFYADYPDKLIEAMKQGAHVQLLLLDPSSPFARQRSLDLQSDDDNQESATQDVPNNIRANIRQFAAIYPKLAEPDGELELGLYNALPSLSIHQVDNKALIGFFPHHVQTTGFLLIEIRMDSPFGKQIDAKFERMWNDATLIDLVPPSASPSNEANRSLIEPLSDREHDVLCLICEGLTNQEIADKLVVALSTVRTHINHIYAKLGVRTRSQAMRKAHELDLC